MFGKLQGEKKKGNISVGLGLSISQKIVKELQGDITVQSALNKGSEFSFNVILDSYQFYDLQSLSKRRSLVFPNDFMKVSPKPIKIHKCPPQLKSESFEMINSTGQFGKNEMSCLMTNNVLETQTKNSNLPESSNSSFK